MKTIGLIGGMSWESTVTYYKKINELVNNRLGGLHSARILLHSVDFQEIEECQACGQWQKSGEILALAAKGLERAGADFILVCTNTMHKVAPQIEAAIDIPLVHIADATADRLEESGINRVALLGTKYTMSEDFYKARLERRGIQALIPSERDMNIVNAIIFGELCKGIIRPEAKAEFLRIINELAEKGAEGVILGCTEIGLLIEQADVQLPVFDTTLIHAEKAVELGLGE